ncbi:BURP domain-containing protein [Dioscorea alata]|uniref:BURP domain-containing protein n=2 Tax=Dioscorea alata TaxID=55571 RepID=A0ACB7TT47_DIOAL|nr:BURP domain-containing protein [Dioscorea alata]KAH7651484.1 BURP domain-containing protein [Dioscorea alata]
MKHFLSVLALILITITSTHASTAQIYWHKMLPNSPMPRAILDLISSDELGEEKTGTTVNVGKGGVAVNTGKPGGSGTNVNVGHGGVGVNVKGKGNTQVGVGKGGVSVNTGHKGEPVVVKVHPGGSPFNYIYAATETQVHDDPQVALFFLEKDLSPSSKFDLRFTKMTSGSPFLSRSQANTIPFSSNKLPGILTRFQVEPSSVTAKAIKKTLVECEEPAMDGESKLCATSLESMMEFSMMSLGTRDVQASSTTVKEKSGDVEVKKTYSVAPAGVRALGGEKLVACHAQPYPYAVFYCHTTGKSKAYKVALVGNDGTKVEAVAVCHLDTAKWNPKHLAFQVLKVKPGSIPVCHFLPEDHVVWSVSK